MFDDAKRGQAIDARTFKRRVGDLRTRLLHAQLALDEQRIPAIVLVAGLEGAGKGHVVNRLTEWLDPRRVRVHAFWDPTDEERERPPYWRYWRAMPPAGEISVLFGGWYQRPIEASYFGEWDEARLGSELGRIRAFEQMLARDGMPIIKLWYHFDEATQRARLDALGRDDRSRWRMLPGSPEDVPAHYARHERIAERLLGATTGDDCPWHIVEATDPNHRDLDTGERVLAALEGALAGRARPPSPPPSGEPAATASPAPPTGDRRPVIDRLELDQRLPKKAYRARLATLQHQLNELAWAAHAQHRSMVAVFEGVDAAGKGGAIRRVTQGVDARLHRSFSFGAPTDEERAHHYLWRFWRAVPRAGYMALFDRSWYGRVLVERVEGFTPEWRWRLAYGEIADFEQQLHEHGVVLVKFWMQISAEEQLRRFEARERTPHKRHKITAEDWRNREHWDAYRHAVDDMVRQTSTAHAPWTLVGANDKRHARIEVLQTLVDRLAGSLGES